jgi:hypothetical protein
MSEKAVRGVYAGRLSVTLITRRLEGILGGWKEGLTTAFLEGLNCSYLATERKACDHRATEYQGARLRFVAGKLEIPY